MKKERSGLRVARGNGPQKLKKLIFKVQFQPLGLTLQNYLIGPKFILPTSSIISKNLEKNRSVNKKVDPPGNFPYPLENVLWNIDEVKIDPSRREILKLSQTSRDYHMI